MVSDAASRHRPRVISPSGDGPFAVAASKGHFDFGPFLRRHRKTIIREWVHQLHTRSGRKYAERPEQELLETVTEAFEADYHVLVNEDFGPIDEFIEKITRIRLSAGFPLSAVQNAFELFRKIAVPLLAEDLPRDRFSASLAPLNRCLAYTIHRFSDYFQEMHEKTIREHNLQLEEQVRSRTAELIESEKKYKTLVEEINDGYFVVQDGIIVFANRAFARIHGCSTGEMIGQNIARFIAPEYVQIIETVYTQNLQSEAAPKAFEYMRLTRDGGIYPTEIMARLVDYENKPSVLGICRDITQRVEMERRVREAERMATIGQITTSLSHEIRNPLSAVKLNLQILRKNLRLDGNDKRRLEISEQEVMRLEGILLELLDFAKPLKLRRTACDIHPIVTSAIELLELKFQQKGVGVFYTFDPALPAVWADGEKLGQAFINLLLNAFEASSKGAKVWVDCRGSAGHSEEGVHVRIRDEGPGIGSEVLDHIFEPFFTTKTSGTGLGLTNVKRIVEAHGGRVEFSCTGANGSAFDIWLPARRGQGPDPTESGTEWLAP